MHCPSFATAGRAGQAWARAATPVVAVRLGRLTGTRLVWPVHTLQPPAAVHTRPGRDRLQLAGVGRRAGGKSFHTSLAGGVEEDAPGEEGW